MTFVHGPNVCLLEMSDAEYRDNMVVFFIAGHVSRDSSLNIDGG